MAFITYTFHKILHSALALTFFGTSLPSITSFTISLRTLEELLEVLKGHYKPARLVIAERFNFHRRHQQPGQSAAQYMVELRRLAKTCHFGQFLNDALRDQLVCGLIATNIQKRLLSEANLTAERTLEIRQWRRWKRGPKASKRNTKTQSGKKRR